MQAKSYKSVAAVRIRAGFDARLADRGIGSICSLALLITVLAGCPAFAESALEVPSLRSSNRHVDGEFIEGSKDEPPIEADPSDVSRLDASRSVARASVASPSDVSAFSIGSETLEGIVDPQRFMSTLQLVVTMAIVGLVPAALLMTTSYVRISIVLSLLRQGFGAQQLLPAQATTALAVFCTGLIMWPTWTAVHNDAVRPLLDGVEVAELESIWERGVKPMRQFMARQIERNGNADDIHLFLQHVVSEGEYPQSYEEVPLRALMPGFLLSELKTAFLIGFQIYLPFLVIDLVVATFATSLGMFMLPPHMISLPLKLLMFVMVGGWHLIVEMLLQSFV